MDSKGEFAFLCKFIGDHFISVCDISKKAASEALNDFDKNGDVKSLCTKLANNISMYSAFTNNIAKNLQTEIKNHKLQEDLSVSLAILEKVTKIDSKSENSSGLVSLIEPELTTSVKIKNEPSGSKKNAKAKTELDNQDNDSDNDSTKSSNSFIVATSSASSVTTITYSTDDSSKLSNTESAKTKKLRSKSFVRKLRSRFENLRKKRQENDVKPKVELNSSDSDTEGSDKIINASPKKLKKKTNKNKSVSSESQDDGDTELETKPTSSGRKRTRKISSSTECNDSDMPQNKEITSTILNKRNLSSDTDKEEIMPSGKRQKMNILDSSTEEDTPIIPTQYKNCDFSFKDRENFLKDLTEHIKKYEENPISGELERNEVVSSTNDPNVPSSSSSQSNSNLLKLVREEIVPTTEQESLQKLVDHALKELANSEDLTDINSIGPRVSLKEIQLSNKIKLCRQFGITKELIVNSEKLDISSYSDVDLFIRNQSKLKSNEDCIDYLCDINNIKLPSHHHNHHKKSRHLKRKNKLAEYKSSDSSTTSIDELCSDPNSENENSDVKNEPDSLVFEFPNINNDTDLLNALESTTDEDTVSWHESEDSEDEKNDKKIKKVKPRAQLEENKILELKSNDEEDVLKIKESSRINDPLLAEVDSLLRDSGKGKSGKKATNSDTETTIPDIGENNEEILKIDLDSYSSGSEIEFVALPKMYRTITLSDDDEGVVINGKGRKNIRALLDKESLTVATQLANSEERERIKRLQERDKDKQKESFSQSSASFTLEIEAEALILDSTADAELKVDKSISSRLKPHQKEGIQFMFDSCYESIKQIKQGYKGSGCILAHCMGLGKTLQALALIQVLFNYKKMTKTENVLVVCPLSTVSNWKREFDLAYRSIKNCHVALHTIEGKKSFQERVQTIRRWGNNGGVLIMSYECFGLMTNEEKLSKMQTNLFVCKEDMLKALIDPGPDLVICDEGHLLRNKLTQRSLALNRVRTRRRIILTGTPLQNNLLEYFCMVNFVKPDLLGTETEFKINFVNPINNGQFEDSTDGDIMLMKKRTHVLHKILHKTVQRVEDTELKQYLPKLIDQAVFVKLSKLQIELYSAYLDTLNAQPMVFTKEGTISRRGFLADVHALLCVCSHPDVLTTAKRTKKKIAEKDVLQLDDQPDLDINKIIDSRSGWYKNILPVDGTKLIDNGTKISIALGIIEEGTAMGDKVLLFSQFYAEMDTIEYFLKTKLKFVKNVDYFRMDGTINPSIRFRMCEEFNNPRNKRVRVFIMSVKVGGLGLNLTAANRVIIMNVNWNPSYDTQSVFRAFRFGQTKPVYVYRLIAVDTMEEKMYQKAVAKSAIAHRVVDKHQITRHYTLADLHEYYSCRPTNSIDRPLPNVPEDCILAKIIQKFKLVYRWHEHQALLANRPEEDLDEHQKNAAWEEFNTKPTVPVPETTATTTTTTNFVQQNENSLNSRSIIGSQIVGHNYLKQHFQHVPSGSPIIASTGLNNNQSKSLQQNGVIMTPISAPRHLQQNTSLDINPILHRVSPDFIPFNQRKQILNSKRTDQQPNLDHPSGSFHSSPLSLKNKKHNNNLVPNVVNLLRDRVPYKDFLNLRKTEQQFRNMKNGRNTPK